ncbi:unnamed protein product, partial [marine sediment metagenome]
MNDVLSGFAVATGTTTPAVALDFAGNEIIRASVGRATIQVSSNIYITGSVAFEKGAIEEFKVADGALPISEIAGELKSLLDIDLDPLLDIPATGAESTNVSIMTIGASNVQAFIGMKGPYWTYADDAIVNGGDNDGKFDENEADPDAVGLVIEDFDFGMAILKPVNILDFGKYFSLKGSAEQISLVGIDDVTLSAESLLVEVNLSSPNVYGLSLFPVIDYASTFPDDEREELFNVVAA